MPPWFERKYGGFLLDKEVNPIVTRGTLQIFYGSKSAFGTSRYSTLCTNTQRETCTSEDRPPVNYDNVHYVSRHCGIFPNGYRDAHTLLLFLDICFNTSSAHHWPALCEIYMTVPVIVDKLILRDGILWFTLACCSHQHTARLCSQATSPPLPHSTFNSCDFRHPGSLLSRVASCHHNQTHLRQTWSSNLRIYSSSVISRYFEQLKFRHTHYTLIVKQSR